MKILFYRYGSICEPGIIDGFRELGHEVYEEKTAITCKNMTMQQEMDIIKKRLFEQAVDCVFSINFFPIVSELCNIFCIRYICWTVDSPVMELYTKSVCNPWNRIFLFDMAQYREFYEKNPDRIFHLPLAANVEEKDKIFQQASVETKKKFTHDIAFVGSLYTEKCPYDRLENSSDYLKGYLDAVMAAQMKVYGYYFVEEVLSDDIIKEFKEHLPFFYELPMESFLTDRATVAQLYVGNKISALERVHTMNLLGEKFGVDLYTASDTSELTGVRNRGLAESLVEMPLIFHQSAINLNMTSKAIRAGLPLRIWDIISCGGFVMTNYQEEIMNYFVPGEDLAVYASDEELLELTQYYLSHEKERKEMAYNACEKVRKYHTYPIRLAQMLVQAFSI